MTHELRIERLFDAPPEVVFDAFVDPDAQQELYAGDPGWTLDEFETDLRVGGTQVAVMRQEGHEPDRETRLFTEVDRPHRLCFRHSMAVGDWGRTIETEMTITFEDQDGKTLLTMVQTGFETEKDRDDFLGGWPSYLDSLQRVVSARHAENERGAAQ